MQILPTAPQPDFDLYVIRQGVWFAGRGNNDKLEDVYAAGYAPYSGTVGLHNVFYNARNARVVLPEFALTSENRRIAKKFDGQFTKVRTPISDFVPDEEFYAFVLAYFAGRLGPRVMPRERLELLFASGLISTIVHYKREGKTAGYVFEVEDGTMRHYWYSAYDLTLARQSLGLWLMLDCIRDAKESGFRYYYLGTVYGEKALYKTNFAPLQWWDGKEWNSDVQLLKERGRSD